MSSTRPRPTSFGTILRSSSHAFASGIAIVSVSTLCSSTTSTSRSRILSMKSKWSRRAFCTHSTSSNSRSSQLVGVSRSCARPGRAHQHLAQLADLGVNAVIRRTDSSLQLLSRRGPLDLDRPSCQGHHTRDGAEDDHAEQHRLGGPEDAQTPFASRLEVQRGGRRVQNARQEKLVHSRGVDQEQACTPSPPRRSTMSPTSDLPSP